MSRFACAGPAEIPPGLLISMHRNCYWPARAARRSRGRRLVCLFGPPCRWCTGEDEPARPVGPVGRAPRRTKDYPFGLTVDLLLQAGRPGFRAPLVHFGGAGKGTQKPGSGIVCSLDASRDRPPVAGRQPTVDSRQSTADGRQPTADSRQPTGRQADKQRRRPLRNTSECSLRAPTRALVCKAKKHGQPKGKEEIDCIIAIASRACRAQFCR